MVHLVGEWHFELFYHVIYIYASSGMHNLVYTTGCPLKKSQLEEFEDTKWVIRIRISKDRQHNGQKKKYKRTNNDLQNMHIKLKIE